MPTMARGGAIHMKSVAYAMTTLGSSMMHSVFMFYYVKVYINFFHVSQPWFQFAQVIFMIWNAINDPLFGYVQDNYNFSWVKSRRHSILYGALPFVISFLLPWFPWGDYSTQGLLAGFQLLVVLCLYDALFTFVLLAQCALFTEMSQRQDDRLRLVKYSQIASVVGSSAVFFCNLFSKNLEDYHIFQVCCVVIAVLAFLCISYTGKHSNTEYDVSEVLHDTEILLGKSLKEPLSSTKSTEFSYWKQTLQIFSQRNFVSFVLMNFLQIFHSVFLTNFTGIICDQLISDEYLSANTRSTFYGALFLLPQILVILGATTVGHFGYYRVIRWSFAMKICLGGMLYVIGPQWWYLVIHFILDNCMNGATFSLFNLPLSDIIDVDKDKYNRKHPLSSMVFGTNALVTKPAISLAPMIITAILASYGYEEAIALASTEASIAKSNPAALHHSMFIMACVVPVVVGILQTVIWSVYTIRDSHITVTKYVEV